MSSKAYGSITITDLTDITSVKTYFLITSSSTAPGISTSGWSEQTASPTAAKPYLWSYTETFYGNNTTSTSAVILLAKYTENGKSIGSATTNVYYMVSSSATEHPDETSSGWKATVQATSVESPYLWVKITTSIYLEGNSDTPINTVSSYSVSSTMDSIEVGGRNLLKGTKNFSGSDYQTPYITSETYNDFTVVFYDNTAATSGFIDIAQFNLEEGILQPSTTYIFSFFAKGSGKLKCHFYPSLVAKIETSQNKAGTAADGNIDIDIDNTWTRYWVKYTTASSISGNKKILHRVYYGNKVYTCGWKLEKGNKATDWTPAPEDIDSNFAETNLKIQQVEKAIKDNSFDEKISEVNKNAESLAIALGLKEISTADLEEYAGTWGVKATEGGATLVTEFITSKALATNAIISRNYSHLDENETFSTAGSFFDLESGDIISPSFTVISDEAYFKGNIDAESGTIGGFTIKDNSLFTENLSTSSPMFAGISANQSEGNSGYLIWAGKKVNSDGTYPPQGIVNDAPFRVGYDGTIYASKGTIGGIGLSEENGLNAGIFFLKKDGSFKFGDILTGDSNGNVSLKTLTIGDFDSGVQSSLQSADSLSNRIIISNDQIELRGMAGNDKNSLVINSEKMAFKNLSGNEVASFSSDGFNIQNRIKAEDNYISFANTNGEVSLKISNDTIEFLDNDNNSSLSIKNDEILIGQTDTKLELTSSGLHFKSTDNATLFNIGAQGYIFGDIDAPTEATNYFIMGNNLVYDGRIGLLFGENAYTQMWGEGISQKIDVVKEWDGDTAETSEDKSINLLVTKEGIGFFERGKLDNPIAYFSSDKFYVNRTQVVTEQQISGFKWYVRNASDYLRDGKSRNLGFKWVG